MEVGDNLGKIFLGLLLPGHIAELHPLGALDVDLGLGAAQAEHHGVPAAPHALHHLAGHVLADGKENQEGQHPGQQDAHKGGHFLHNLPGKICPGLIEPLGEVRIVYPPRLADGALPLFREDNLVFLDIHLFYILGLGLLDKGAVVHFLYLLGLEVGHEKMIEGH